MDAIAEVASAYVSLVPSARGFGRSLEGQVGGEVSNAGKSLGGKLMTGLKVTGLAAAGAVGGVMAVALTKGFSRLNAIDQAKAKLSGLGNSAKTVDKIMANALASVKGTAFGLDEAATTAASAVAAGIKPGKELTGVLKTVADTATIAGKSMADTGAIFGSVAARGKLQGDDLMQLQSAGVPVLAMLAKHYGITAAAASKMVTKGQVDFKNFNAAMQENLGGAALKSGQTFTGAFANLKASLGRIGANLLSGLFPKVKDGIGKLTGFLSGLEPIATKVGAAIGKYLGKAFDFVKEHLPEIKALAKSLLDLGQSVGGKVVTAIKNLAATFGPLIEQVGNTVIKNAPAVFKAIGTALSAVGTVLTSVTGFMRDHATSVQAIAVAVGAGVLAWKTWTTAIKVWQAVTKAAAAAQAALNVVMSANPIMLVVIAIAALAAGLIYAYKHSETFRNVINGAFSAVGAAAKFMWDKVLRPTFKFIVDVWMTVVGAIVHGAATAFGWVPGVGPKLKAAAKEFDKLRARVDASLDGIGDEAAKYGSDWAAGLARGIAKGGAVPIATARGVANKIAAASRAALDSHSPSRVAAKIGGDFTDGLAVGITAKSKRATDAAKTVAKKVAEAASTKLKVTKSQADLTRWLDTLMPGLVGSQEKLTSTVTAIGKKVQAAFLAAAGSGKAAQTAAIQRASKFTDSLSSATSKLGKVAADRLKVADALKAAQDKLTSAIQVRDDFAKSVTDNLAGWAAITGTQSGDGNPLSSGSIIAQMTAKLSGIKKFAANLASLRSSGLNDDTYAQLVQAGVESGGPLSQALLEGGRDAVQQVNSLSSQITAESTRLGQSAAKSLYQAGVDAAQGLVDGLKSQESLLLATADRIAAQIVARLKKALDIHSPSRVMAREIGVPMAQGLIAGFQQQVPGLERAVLTAVPSVRAGSVGSFAAGGGGMTVQGPLVAVGTVREEADAQMLARVLDFQLSTRGLGA